MFSTFINAMKETERVAVVRYVAKGSTRDEIYRLPDPRIGLLVPSLESPEFCYYCQVRQAGPQNSLAL